MTFVGKVLVGLQLALSLFLMAFAGAVVTVQNNWKAEHANLTETLKGKDAEIGSLEAALETTTTELTGQLQTQTDRANRLESQLAGAQQQVAALTQENETIKSERDTQRTIAQVSGQEANFRKQEAVKQRALNNQLYKQQDELIALRNNLETELFKKELDEKTITAKHEQVLTQLSDLRKAVAQTGINIDPGSVKALTTPPPVVDGIVEATQKSSRGVTQYVQISIGSDDGLVEGHELDVYRTGLHTDSRPVYLGKIKLTNVEPDRAVGIVTQSPKNGIIERGDNVTTQL